KFAKIDSMTICVSKFQKTRSMSQKHRFLSKDTVFLETLNSSSMLQTKKMDHSKIKASTKSQQISKYRFAHMHANPILYLLSTYFNRVIESFAKLDFWFKSRLSEFQKRSLLVVNEAFEILSNKELGQKASFSKDSYIKM
ncbi:MAG: hypothetical protein AAF620_16240, partial [Bacteroidota bacterium]